MVADRLIEDLLEYGDDQNKQPDRDETAPQSKTVEDEDRPAQAPRKGRPRSKKSRRAILNAVNKLLLHQSVQELSIEAIAKKAKVGKTTIYRWWPNKAAVVIDALMEQPAVQAPLPTPADNTEAVKMQLEKLIRLMDGAHGRVITQLITEAQADEKSQEVVQNNFLGPLLDAMEYSIAEGIRAGEFRAGLDAKMAVDMVCGPVLFRAIAHPDDLNKSFERDFPNEALKFLQ